MIIAEIYLSQSSVAVEAAFVNKEQTLFDIGIVGRRSACQFCPRQPKRLPYNHHELALE
jgi:hypothetical protein